MSAGPRTCQRRGCSTRLHSWQRICSPCWDEIPAAERARIAQLGKDGRYGARDEARKAAVKALGRKGTGPAIEAARHAYTNIARITGERDEDQAA